MKIVAQKNAVTVSYMYMVSINVWRRGIRSVDLRVLLAHKLTSPRYLDW